MAKAKKQQEQTPPSNTDRAVLVIGAHSALKKAKTAEDVRAVWKDHYLLIGHRILGRLLLGQDAESAIHRRRREE